MDIKTTIKHTLEKDGELLYKFEDYTNDKEVVLAAVGNSGKAIRFASNKLKEDEDVITKAITQDEKAYYYLPKKKKEDIELFAQLVRVNNNVLRVRNDFSREDIFEIYKIIAREFTYEEKEQLKQTLSDKQRKMLYCAENTK